MDGIKTIEIGPTTYKVEHTKEAITEERIGQNDANVQATITYSKSKNVVSPDLEESQKRLALWHEITHGILCDLGLTMINNEDVVTPLASKTLEVLRRNPELVAYLVGE
jgi:hypothetical protein